jgi:hypothetical protein
VVETVSFCTDVLLYSADRFKMLPDIRAATFSFDQTRRCWIYRKGGGGYFLKSFFFTKTYIEKFHIYITNKITFVRNKFYFHVYFLFFETLFNSSPCSGLFRKSRKSAHVESKLNFAHSSDLTSSTLMLFLPLVQLLPRIEKILSTYALLMGTERIFAQHRTVFFLFHIRFAMCNVAISPNKI